MKDKRVQLIEASVELFAKEGFWNTSTSRISRHAGVATGTLFNYFDSKEALINEVYLYLKLEVRDYVLEHYPKDAELIECMRYLWNRYAQWAFQNPVRFRLMEQLRLSEMVSDKTINEVEAGEALMIEVIEAAHALGMSETLSSHFVCKMTYAMLVSMIIYATDQQLTGEELKNHIEAGFYSLIKGFYPHLEIQTNLNRHPASSCAAKKANPEQLTPGRGPGKDSNETLQE